jgi:hypothetical protein
MPLGAGVSDKLGNRYEGRWAVNCMLDVMGEVSDSIKLEPPGIEGEGIEFWVKTGSYTEYYQVKRQITSKGKWSIRQLNEEKVLQTFFEKLADTNVTCIFASTYAAADLGELAERAKISESFELFEQVMLQAKQHSGSFNQLVSYQDKLTKEEIYERLKRIEVRTMDENSLVSLLTNKAKALLKADWNNARDVLAQFALDHLQESLSAHEIWNHLDNRRFKRNHWTNNSEVIALVKH